MGDPAVAPLRARLGVLSGIAAAAGLAAGAAMAATLMAIAEISSEPTAVPGVDSTTWTPLTAITSFLFGDDAFHGSFNPLSIAFGLAAHLMLSVLFGALGFTLLVWVLGYMPGPLSAALLGLAYGVGLEILFLNLVVNAIQDQHTVYESLPQWGWWVAHAAYGVTLGLVAAGMLRGARLLGGAEAPVTARAPASAD